MAEIHLRQPAFAYSACRPFTKNKERLQNLKKQEIPDIFVENQIIRKKLDKACFQHDMAFCGGFKDL